jgi:hypothetical protein
VSSSSPPPAEGVRVHWDQLPLGVRRELEKRIGDTVVEAVTQPGGFSPGLAARVLTRGGRRCFVKAVSELANPDTPDLHRREADVVAALPVDAPVPRLLWTYDHGGWVALGFEDVDGHNPAQPWRSDELRLVMDGRRAGLTRLNFDIRADNIRLAGNLLYFVDWTWARIGSPFVEWVALAPSVHMQGGPAPEELLGMASLGAVDEGAINAVLASITGFFLGHSLRPPPPGIPTVRAFQAAQGEVALAWLRRRTGWR